MPESQKWNNHAFKSQRLKMFLENPASMENGVVKIISLECNHLQIAIDARKPSSREYDCQRPAKSRGEGSRAARTRTAAEKSNTTQPRRTEANPLHHHFAQEKTPERKTTQPRKGPRHPLKTIHYGSWYQTVF